MLPFVLSACRASGVALVMMPADSPALLTKPYGVPTGSLSTAVSRVMGTNRSAVVVESVEILVRARAAPGSEESTETRDCPGTASVLTVRAALPEISSTAKTTVRSPVTVRDEVIVRPGRSAKVEV